MPKLKHILVPTDGSKGSFKAAALAGDLARALDARATILFVQDERFVLAEAWNSAAGMASPENLSGSVEDTREAMERRANSTEIAATMQALGKVPGRSQKVQVWGHPSDEICSYAKDNDVDLIVMGSHGRSTLMRAMLGSISHNVVNAAPCAVTIVR